MHQYFVESLLDVTIVYTTTITDDFFNIIIKKFSYRFFILTSSKLDMETPFKNSHANLEVSRFISIIQMRLP